MRFYSIEGSRWRQPGYWHSPTGRVAPVSHYSRMAGLCKHSESGSLLLRYFMVASGMCMRESEISVVGEERRLLVKEGQWREVTERLLSFAMRRRVWEIRTHSLKRTDRHNTLKYTDTHWNISASTGRNIRTDTSWNIPTHQMKYTDRHTMEYMYNHWNTWADTC